MWAPKTTDNVHFKYVVAYRLLTSQGQDLSTHAVAFLFGAIA